MRLTLNILPYQVNHLFKTISDIYSFIDVKLKVLEILKTCWMGNLPVVRPFLCLDTELDRVFLINQDGKKIISFTFGFNVKVHDCNLEGSNNYIRRIGYKSQPQEITEEMVSGCFSILSDLRSREDNIYWALNLSDSVEGMTNYLEIVQLFEYIMMQEPGYLRYDDDLKNERKPFHPRYHIDVNYSELAHYKIGLGKSITMNDIWYMLAADKKCPYLQIEHSKYDILEPIELKKKRKKKRNKRANMHK